MYSTLPNIYPAYTGLQLDRVGGAGGLCGCALCPGAPSGLRLCRGAGVPLHSESLVVVGV